ncbi:MAG: putative transport system permease protein [Solirubrobacteraceae bacterium]|jgi:putative ABC transport system permease protein|nr:putative transport system permease protein [Solirubrobacteraceae bacterium]
MKPAATLALAGLVRAPGRTLTRVLVLAAAVGLLGAMLLFIGSSLRSMTGAAVRSVPLDWQGPVPSYRTALRIAGAVGHQPGVEQATAAATAPFARVSHSGAAGLSNAGAGSLLAVPPGYDRHFNVFRFLQGKLEPGHIVLDQQLAATLQARIGDRVAVTPRPGARSRSFVVSGIALITAPDVVFQPLNPQIGPAPAQPPSNAAILPLDTFARTLAPALHAIVPATLGSSAVPGAQNGAQWQVQAQASPSQLGHTPGQAYTRSLQIVNRIERTLPGQVQFVNNLSDKLNTAAGDALYAETLYIMLALPGALVGLGLAYIAALGTVERDRRELALLRVRGATRAHLVGLAGTESLVIGVLAGLVGTGAAIAAVQLLITGGVGLTPARGLVTGAVCVALATVGAMAARIGASAAVWRTSVSASRRSVRREGKPLWQRLYLDLLALALSGLIYWLTASTGFSAVVNPDSNPTLSLSIYMFFAPALLWIGATLLLVRLRGRALAAAARRVAGGRARTPRGFLLASAGRRGAAINRGLVVVGLLLAFGVNLGIFTATYDQQASVDAQLTLGADVTASAPPGVSAQRDLAGVISRVPGVSAATAVDHSYAYVGPDLQDTFGINPSTFTKATSLRDSYFLRGTAAQMLSRLKARPDGILVSKETISDYSLGLGDLLRLRVLDHRTGRFHVVPFHVVGVVQEFPSAPRDSFMVANLSYLTAADQAGGPNIVFAKASNPAATAARVAAATRSDGTIVKNVTQQAQDTVSSITTVDLRGISKILEAFTVVLAAAAMGLFIALGHVERRQEFATMAALGARTRVIQAFAWSEAGLVLAASVVLAAVLGWLLSEMLIAMLQHVFDPPPDSLAVPWRYLAELVGAAVLGTVIAAALAARGLARMSLGAALREE